MKSPRWLILFLLAAQALAAPILSPIFGDNMVLQRGKPATFWGWADAGQEVRVDIAGKGTRARAGADGRWQASVELPPPGGPYEVAISGPSATTLKNVLVGDVWICGGQSNMDFSLQRSHGGSEAAAAAQYPQMRFYSVPARSAYAPEPLPLGSWKICTPESAAGFSAVAFYFGRKLQQELNVPIGLIKVCLGGSPAESWMSTGALERVGEFNPQLAEIKRLHAQGGYVHGSFLMHWLDEYDKAGKNAACAQPAFDDHAWGTIELPGSFGELSQGSDPVVAWFRKEVTLPDPLPSGAARILLGSVEKMDTTYINGRLIGLSSWVENPRAYSIPKGVLRPGKNVIAVRVLRTKKDGGFMVPSAQFLLEVGDAHLSLAGSWKALLSFEAKAPHPLPLDWENYPTMPAVLHNGMLAPLAPLGIAGVLWYQGEANSTRAAQYARLMPALIADWRELFQQGEFPFYIVSLPAFMQRRSSPMDDGWARIRDAQELAVRLTRNTGLAVTIDTGDANDIHPKEKKLVGERLALCALAGHFGRNVEAKGPSLRFMERRGGKLILNFDHAEGGLKVHGDTPGEFSIAGADRKWHWAKAELVGRSIVLSSPEVPDPVAARYAWQANPLANLTNAAGLPAGPFRTDDWNE